MCYLKLSQGGSWESQSLSRLPLTTFIHKDILKSFVICLLRIVSSHFTKISFQLSNPCRVVTESLPGWSGWMGDGKEGAVCGRDVGMYGRGTGSVGV